MICALKIKKRHDNLLKNPWKWCLGEGTCTYTDSAVMLLKIREYAEKYEGEGTVILSS